jgi:hypothetical protein
VAFGRRDDHDGQVTFSLDSDARLRPRRLHAAAVHQRHRDAARPRPEGHPLGRRRGRHDQRGRRGQRVDAFASSVYSLIQQYGFNGVDIDLENGVNPTYMASALEQLESDVGSSLIITLAPQTVDTQSTGDDYFQLALDIKSILTMINTQYYNSGTMNGCDGNVYAEGTENFMTALACTELEGGLSPPRSGSGSPRPPRRRAAATSRRRSSTTRSTAWPPGPTAAASSRRNLAGHPRRHDLVDQLGRVQRLQLRRHGGALPVHAPLFRSGALALRRSAAASRTPPVFLSFRAVPGYPVGATAADGARPSSAARIRGSVSGRSPWSERAATCWSGAHEHRPAGGQGRLFQPVTVGIG